MKYFIIHGTKGNPLGNWFPWLKGKLESESNTVFVPEFPTPENQSLDNWIKIFDEYLSHIDEETIFIGHSLGPAFILSVLEKLKTRVKACYFVSGFLGLLGNGEFDNLNKTFTTKSFDWNKIKNNCDKFVMFHSDNDPYVPLEKAKELSEKLGVEIKIIKGAEHLNEESGYTKFEELWDEIKGDRDNLPYRKNCEGYLVYGNKIVGRDTKYGYIDFPGGGVDDGEDIKEALKREAFEEAGAVLDGELKEVGIVKTTWPNDWAKNEKQKKRFEKYRGDEMHFFVCKVKELLEPIGDHEENGWDINERLIPIKKAIEIIESYKPFPKELEEYYEFKLKILRGLENDK